MKTNLHLLKTATLLLSLICLGMNSFAQKVETNLGKSEKLIPFKDFKNTDVGPVSKAGIVTNDKNVIQVIASGSDIWGSRDQFHFCYVMINGDFEVTTQVMSLTAANAYTKAGIMARVNLDDNSRHVFYQVFPNNAARNNNNGGCEFQYRAEKAGNMKAIYPDPATAGKQFDVAYPNTYIRLKRTGDVFESYFSTDNKNWKLYTTYTLKLPEELMVGLAVTSHNANEYTIAKFASVKLAK
jgi:regulation of enolase protein 1 (concanavalin A-like superfamily)